jgi:nicotinate-nucleotide adenylyltransferase
VADGASRLGILGGTFDPPHVGHLLAASDAYEALSLDRLIFVPAAVQPLKADRRAAPAEHRLEMVRRLAGTDPRFGVDPVEIGRPGLSFTVDTLATFAAKWPDAERFLLVGADVLETFGRWRKPEEVLRLARMAVMVREGSGGDVGTDARFAALEAAASRAGAPAPARLTTRRVDISSTEIRERLATGRPIRGFVTEAVAEYIDAYRLYR